MEGGVKTCRRKGLVNSFKKIISDPFEPPKELVLDLPRMTMVGNVQFYLENHRGVIAYDQERSGSVSNGS